MKEKRTVNQIIDCITSCNDSFTKEELLDMPLADLLTLHTKIAEIEVLKIDIERIKRKMNK